MTSVRVDCTPETSLSSSNLVYCSAEDYFVWSTAGTVIRLLGENPYFGYKFVANDQVPSGVVWMNSQQRLEVFVARNDVIKAEILPQPPVATAIVFSISHKIKKKNATTSLVSIKLASSAIYDKFQGQPFSIAQKVYIKIEGVSYALTVQSIVEQNVTSSAISEMATMAKNTVIQLTTASDSYVNLEGLNPPFSSKGGEKTVEKPRQVLSDVPLEKMGVGGLGKEFRTIFRRAFASRCLDPMEVKRLNLKHVKGILLYGPPGTGKTLLAHTIGKMLNTRKPIDISAPELLNKYVGEGDKAIRELFQEAEKEYKEKGENSALHLITIDEMDAVFRQRSSATTTTSDSLVNQMLDKMDGSKRVSNVLVIGMTNRKDLIDKALLRPGRFEVHIQVSLPSEKGRLEILKIHTAALASEGKLEDTIKLEELAANTKNFSGAELAGLVGAATGFALERALQSLHSIDPDALDWNEPDGTTTTTTATTATTTVTTTTPVGSSDPNRRTSLGSSSSAFQVSPTKIFVKKIDFDRALIEAEPAYGVMKNRLTELIPEAGFINYSEEVSQLIDKGLFHIKQVENSPILRLMTGLIVGPPGSGKSTLAARIAERSGIPMIKYVSPEDFTGMTELAIAGEIKSIFKDLNTSPCSLLILDNIEQIIGYSALSLETKEANTKEQLTIPARMQYSNVVLQSLEVFCKRQPSPGKRLFILGTASDSNTIKLLGIDKIFDKKLLVPLVKTEGKSKTIQEALLDIENSRMLDAHKDFETKLKGYGKAFERLSSTQKQDKQQEQQS